MVHIYEDFDVAYYYGYGTGDNINKPQYWQITNPTLLLLYTNSNLLRSFQAIDYNGTTVVDAYSRPGPSNCFSITDSSINNNGLFLIIIFTVIFIILMVLLSRRI